MNEKNTSKFIRPAGAFPQTFEGWKEYQDQFDDINDADDFFEDLNDERQVWDGDNGDEKEELWSNNPDVKQHEVLEGRWIR